MHIEDAFLAVVTTFVLMTIFAEEIAPIALERLLGPLLGVLLALLLVSWFYDVHAFYLLLVFLLLAAFMYLFTAKVMPYAALMGGITFAFVTFTAIQSPSSAVHLGVDWVRGIIIGGVIAWIFSHFFIAKIKHQKLISINFSNLLPIQKSALKHALRITIAIFFILWTNVYWNWPGGVQALIACTVIVAQPTLDRSYQRMHMRFWGILAGGLFGLLGIILLAHLPYFFTLVILFLIGTWAAAYVALGDQRYAYAGVMAGVIVPMTLLFNQGPLGTLSIAIERFAGVFIGAAVGLIALHYLWPDKESV